MAKKIQVSNDNGATWYTLPGNTGEWSDSGNQVSDTIYGQTFQSNDVGTISATLSANAVYKGFVGYKATVRKMGTSTAFSNQATTQVGSQRYRINNYAMSLWDRDVAITVNDTNGNITSNVVAINFLWGEVVFASGFTPSGSVTVSGNYFPLADIGKTRGFTLTQNAEAIDTSDYPTLKTTGGVMTYDPGLRTFSLDMNGVYDATSDFQSILTSGQEVIIEVNPDGQGKSVARGYFRATNRSQSGDVGALEEESVTFSGNVPDQSATNNLPPETPFSWQHTSDTPLNQATRIILDAWEQEQKIMVQYLYNGVNGYKANAVVTDVSLESSTGGMNSFTANFQIDGQITQV